MLIVGLLIPLASLAFGGLIAYLVIKFIERQDSKKEQKKCK